VGRRNTEMDQNARAQIAPETALQETAATETGFVNLDQTTNQSDSGSEAAAVSRTDDRKPPTRRFHGNLMRSPGGGIQRFRVRAGVDKTPTRKFRRGGEIMRFSEGDIQEIRARLDKTPTRTIKPPSCRDCVWIYETPSLGQAQARKVVKETGDLEHIPLAKTAEVFTDPLNRQWAQAATQQRQPEDSMSEIEEALRISREDQQQHRNLVAEQRQLMAEQRELMAEQRKLIDETREILSRLDVLARKLESRRCVCQRA
jgi:hypothetical protein